MAKLTLSDINTAFASTTTLNANNALIEAALENTLSRDGTTPNAMGANLDMNSYKIINYTDDDPVDDGDLVTKGYLDDQIATTILDDDFDSNGFMVRTGEATYESRSITGGTGVFITNPTGVAGNVVISVGQGLETDDSPTFASLDTTGEITVGTTLEVGQTITSGGAITAGGALNVTSTATLGADLSVAGVSVFNDDMTLLTDDIQIGTTSGVTVLYRPDETGSVVLSGGSTTNTGANIRLFGDSSPSQAGDIQIRSGSNDVKLLWDESADEWLTDETWHFTSDLDIDDDVDISGTLTLGTEFVFTGDHTGVLNFTSAPTYDGGIVEDARSNLGLAIGSDVQEYSAYLQDIIDISPGATGQVLTFNAGTDEFYLATPAGAGDLLAAANETITGTWSFDEEVTFSGGVSISGDTGFSSALATLAAMTALDVTAISAGYTVIVTEADRGGTFVLTDASYTADDGVLFAPDTPSGDLHWRRIYDGPVHTKWFGLTTDGVTDVTDDFDAILQTYNANLYIDAGDYYCEAASLLSLSPVGLQIPDNSRIEWDAGAWFIHEASVDTNHFFAASAGSNITLINPQINGQNATTNLLGFGSADNLLIKGGTLKNVKKSRQMALPDADPVVASGLGGGHGITMQGFSRNCRVVGVHFDTCAIALDGAPKNEGDSELGNVNRSYAGVISACTFHNCDQIFTSAGNVEANGSGEFIYDENETADEYKLSSWLLSACSFHNCGKSDGNVNIEFTRRNSTSSTEYPFACPARSGTSYNPATAGFNWEITDQSTSALALTGGRTAWTDGTSYDATDVVVMNDDGKFGALITGMNAGGIVIDGLSGYNDEDYNGGTNIGAIVWGTFASCKFRNINVNVNTDYMVRFGGTPATVYNTIRHYQVSKFVDFEITNHGNTVYAYRIDNPIGVTNEYKLEGMRLRLAFRETGHTSLVHTNNTAAYATNNKADESYVEIINLETQEVLEGRIDVLGNGSYELGSHSDGIRNISAEPLQIVNHSADAMLRLTRTGTNTADIEVYALADRLQIDGGGLRVSSLGVGATPPTDKAMQVAYDDGASASSDRHEVFKFGRSTGNFRGIAMGYLSASSADTDGYIAANGDQNIVIGHNNNVNTSAPNIFVDGVNDRVGVLTKTPAYALDVNGTVNATAYRVGGTEGENFDGLVTNLTIVNGIVTAAS